MVSAADLRPYPAGRLRIITGPLTMHSLAAAVVGEEGNNATAADPSTTNHSSSPAFDPSVDPSVRA